MRNAERILKTTGIPARHSLAQPDGAERWPGGQRAREGSSSCFSRCQQPQPGRAREGQRGPASYLSYPASSPLLGGPAGWLAAGWAAQQGTRQSTRKPEAGGECKLSTAVIARMAAEDQEYNRQNLNLKSIYFYFLPSPRKA